MFLLPNTPFDANYTALVFFQLPNSQEFKLLGSISHDKPSAIFKINNNKVSNNMSQLDDVDMMDDGLNVSTPTDGPLMIGISIEPNDQANVQLEQAKKDAAVTRPQLALPAPRSSAGELASKDPNSTAVLANRIVQHAYNFLGSFVDSNGKVPMKAFDTWWEKFKAKLQNNPKFLDNVD